MTDNIQIENRKISVTFSRKLTDGNYGGREATAYIQGDIPTDATTPVILESLLDLFMSAQSAVFDTLGVTYEVDAEKGTLVEQHQPKVTVAATGAAAAAAAVAAAMPGSSDASIRVMNAAEQQGELPDWLVQACVRDGVTAVWDNRAKAAGTKAPWFKEAVARGGTGRGKDGEPKAYWPPR